MMNIKGIFAVSLIAMVAMVAGAHTSNAVAAIASQGYVDQQVGLKANATDLARKVDIYQGDAKANQAVITNGTGNITTGFITKSMLGADVEIPAAITVDSALSSTSTNPVQNKVINTALNGKEVTSNKVTSTNYAANVSSDTKYPTVKAVANAIDDAIADVEEKIPDAITVDSALSSTSTNPVQNKVINTALAGKQATLSAAQLNAVNSGITKDKVTTYDGYDEKITAAQSAADDAAAAANGKVTIAQGSGAVNKAVITNSSGNVTTGTISSGMIADDAVTSAKLAAGAVDANALAAGAVTSAKIADDAVTTAKLAAGAVDANALAAGAVTSAKIADGTIVNADIAADAKIVTSKISGLAKVATSGSYGDLTGTPTIPTVNNATLTIKKNGASVGTFTANASANKEIDIEVPAASDILTTTTVTSSGTGAVLTGVSVTAGKVTLQKGNVQIPSGGQNATNYVSIWVE